MTDGVLPFYAIHKKITTLDPRPRSESRAGSRKDDREKHKDDHSCHARLDRASSVVVFSFILLPSFPTFLLSFSILDEERQGQAIVNRASSVFVFPPLPQPLRPFDKLRAQGRLLQGRPLLSCPARSGIQRLCPCPPLTPAPSTLRQAQGSGQALSHQKGRQGWRLLVQTSHCYACYGFAMPCYDLAMFCYDCAMNCYVFCYAMLCFAISCYDCAMFRKAGGQSGS